MINVPEIFRLHQQQYRIIAMVNHIGATMDSGHYTAEIHTDNGWKRCDDAIVRDCGRLKDCSAEAYLLVCERINGKTDEKT